MNKPNKEPIIDATDRSVGIEMYGEFGKAGSAKKYVDAVFGEMAAYANKPSESEYFHVLNTLHRMSQMIYVDTDKKSGQANDHSGFFYGEVMALHARELVVGKGAIDDVYKALNATFYDAQEFAKDMVPFKDRYKLPAAEPARAGHISQKLLSKIHGQGARRIEHDEEGQLINVLAALLAPDNERVQLEIIEGYMFVRHAKLAGSKSKYKRLEDVESLPNGHTIEADFDALSEVGKAVFFLEKTLNG